MESKLEKAFKEVTNLTIEIDHVDKGTAITLTAVHGDEFTEVGFLVDETPRTGTRIPLYSFKRK